MVELADTPDLGSGGRPCRFKSCYPHEAISSAKAEKRESVHACMGTDSLFDDFIRRQPCDKRRKSFVALLFGASRRAYGASRVTNDDSRL